MFGAFMGDALGSYL